MSLQVRTRNMIVLILNLSHKWWGAFLYELALLYCNTWPHSKCLKSCLSREVNGLQDKVWLSDTLYTPLTTPGSANCKLAGWRSFREKLGWCWILVFIGYVLWIILELSTKVDCEHSSWVGKWTLKCQCMLFVLWCDTATCGHFSLF